VPVLKVLVDSTDSRGTCGGKPCSNSIFAGTDLGMFHSSDGGQDWFPYNLGVIPMVPVYDPSQDTIGNVYAGTHGRGVFALNVLSATATPTATQTATATATRTATATVTATSSQTSTVTATPTGSATATATPSVTPTAVPVNLNIPKKLDFGSVKVGASKKEHLSVSNPYYLSTTTPIEIRKRLNWRALANERRGSCAEGDRWKHTGRQKALVACDEEALGRAQEDTLLAQIWLSIGLRAPQLKRVTTKRQEGSSAVGVRLATGCNSKNARLSSGWKCRRLELSCCAPGTNGRSPRR
jgi:hypothetical protein